MTVGLDGGLDRFDPARAQQATCLREATAIPALLLPSEYRKGGRKTAQTEVPCPGDLGETEDTAPPTYMHTCVCARTHTHTYSEPHAAIPSLASVSHLWKGTWGGRLTHTWPLAGSAHPAQRSLQWLQQSYLWPKGPQVWPHWKLLRIEPRARVLGPRCLSSRTTTHMC